MKKIAVVLGLLFGLTLSGGVFSTKAAGTLPLIPSQFEGDWIGIIKMPEGRKMNIRLTITGNDIHQFYKDRDLSWQPLNLSQFQFNPQQEDAVFFWKRADSVRVETNTFILTLKDARTIEVGFTRRINRVKNSYGNQIRKIEGIGKLWRID